METNFNFNSAICTSVEQSRKLLELGLKKETADMVYKPHYVNNILKDYYRPKVLDKIVLEYMLTDDSFKDYIPAWSLHRLIEMMPENVTSDDWLGVSFDDVSYYHGEGEGIIGWKYYKAGANLYDCIIDCIEWLIKEGYFNKEYLEEKK